MISDAVRTGFSKWGDRSLSATRFFAILAAVSAPVSTALTSAACALMLLSWAASGRAITTLRDSVSQPLGIMLALLLGLMAVGTLYSSVPWSVRIEAMWAWRKLAYVLLLLGIFAAGRSDKRLMLAFLSMATLGMLASFLAWFGLLPSKTGQPIGVILQNHSVQGVAFSVAVLFAIFLGRDATGRWRWVLGIIGCGLVANVMFVASGRSGHLALIVVLGLAVGNMIGWRRFYLWIPAAMAAGVIAFAVSPLWRERLAQGAAEISTHGETAEITSMGTRLLYFETAWQLIRARPILGYGTGSYGYEYSAVVRDKYSDWRAKPGTDPHNQYLFIWVENGAVGLLAFLAFLFFAFRRAIQSPAGWAAAGVLAIWCLTSLFNSHFKTFPEGHLFGLVLGILLANGKPSTAKNVDAATPAGAGSAHG